MMIGFNSNKDDKAPDPEVRAITDSNEVEELIKMRGRERLLQLVGQYIDPYQRPLLKGDKRREYFMEKLIKIDERYFQEI